MKNLPQDRLPEDRDGFRFRSGSAPLDLTATLQARLKPQPRELLAEPQDLDRWLVSCGLVDQAPGASAADLDQARLLREAIFTLAKGVAEGGFDASAAAILNAMAEAPAAAPVLKAAGVLAHSASPAGLLALLAREAIYVLGGGNVAQLRQCASPTCTIFFLDTSRAGDRRWCSMAACGNKAKVAEHRRRKRAQSGAAGKGP